MKKFGRKINSNNTFSLSTVILNQGNLETLNEESKTILLYNNNEFHEERTNSKKYINNQNNQDFFLLKTKNRNSNKNDKIIVLSENSERKNLIPEKCDDSHPKKNSYRLSDMEQRNLYFLLGIDENSSEDKIKKSYKKLCLSLHPDKGGDSEKFSKINKAYKILSNNICRIIHDKFSFRAIDLIEHLLVREEETNKYSDLISQESDLEVLRLIIMNY